MLPIFNSSGKRRAAVMPTAGDCIVNDGIALKIEALDVRYGATYALKNISMEIPRNKITALIGPSGCGKSTLLRSINRMHETNRDLQIAITGKIIFNGKNIYDPSLAPIQLRRQIGMVFQTANPLPMSIYDNVICGPKLWGIRKKSNLDNIAETALQDAALWDEVKDKLHHPGTALSGGQQQRLCIARAMAMRPQILLLDEPCSALDPIATQKIEDVLQKLAKTTTIIIVTHNMPQARRIAGQVAYLHNVNQLGEQEQTSLIAYGPAKEILMRPKDKRLDFFIRGHQGGKQPYTP